MEARDRLAKQTNLILERQMPLVKFNLVVMDKVIFGFPIIIIGTNHKEAREQKMKEIKRLEREYYEARLRSNPRLARNKKLNTQIIDPRMR